MEECKKNQRFVRRLLGWGWKHKILLIFLILIVVTYTLRYRHLVRQLPFYNKVNSPSFKELTYPHLTREQVVNLGGAHSKTKHPCNSYLQFPMAKEPGTIRIGIFGCSFVYGMEAACRHNIPTLLQQRFEQAGRTNVEVINFGLGGKGVHQMYLLWQYVGKDYNLDFVVLMPLNFHMRRDEGFCNAYAYNDVYARYILDGDNLKLIPVVGETRKEAIQTYYRFIPPWRYIRYDNKMPMFLRVLLPSIFHNRSNPFYYKPRKFNKDEILEIYARIFTQMAHEVDKLIVLTEGERIYGLEKKVHTPNVYFFKGKIFFQRHLYKAPKRHNSALGNQSIADQLFSLFSGRDKCHITMLELSGLNRDYKEESRSPSSSSLALYQYKEAFASIDKYPLGSFFSGVHKKAFKGIGKDANFKKNKTAGLILAEDFSAGNDLRFIQWSSLLTDGTPVYLSFKAGDKKFKFPIGTVFSRSDIIGKLDLELPKDIGTNDMTWHLETKNGKLHITDGKINRDGHLNIKNVSIIMGEQVLLKGIPANNPKPARIRAFSFTPALFEYLYLRARIRDYIDVRNHKEKKGILDLVLVDERDNRRRLPFLLYEKKTVETLNIEPLNFYVNIVQAKN